MELKFDDAEYVSQSGADLQHPPFTTTPLLVDGGVYDNMGLETAWKRYRTILVSDAGKKMEAEAGPKTNWLSQLHRVFSLVDNQVRSLRVRQVVNAYTLAPTDPEYRSGTYWGIRMDIGNYGLPTSLPCPHDRTMALAAISTRLKAMDDRTQERLINWGYAVCDAAMRRWVVGADVSAPRFPYPSIGV
jgi:NTE family protein